jgi:hypothetical protein
MERRAGWDLGGAQAGEGHQRGRGAHRESSQGLPVPERTELDEEASGRAPGKLPRLECGKESQQPGAGQVLGVGVAVGVGQGPWRRTPLCNWARGG